MAESCWDILGIERTKDKLAIKKAYAKLAHQISPEDDPDGFRRIHTAYKQAIAYASGNSRPPFMIVRNLPVQKREDQPVIVRKTEEDDDSSREDDDESSPEYDFESVGNNPVRRDTSAPREEQKKKSPYDFSSVDTGERDFSDEIEKQLEKIVSFKEENGVDTKENVARWKLSTLLPHAGELFTMYRVLYHLCDDAGVWRVFFKEPLIKRVLVDADFRRLLYDAYSYDTEAGDIIRQECDFYSRHVEEKVTKSKNVKSRPDETDKKVLFNLLGFLGDVIVLIPLTLLVYYAGPWGKKMFPGLILVVSEVMVFFFFRFFTTVSSSTPSPFEPGLTETACFISIMCLANMLYWGVSFSTMTAFSASNIMFIVAGGILGGIAAILMTLKIRHDAETKNS